MLWHSIASWQIKNKIKGEKIMKVSNMESSNGKPVANQFIITDEGRGALGNFKTRHTFQSYKSVIAIITHWDDISKVEIDRNKWDFSVTTGKYRNQFLGETKKETQAKIDSGEYILTDLN
jgi:hypothetical protein